MQFIDIIRGALNYPLRFLELLARSVESVCVGVHLMLQGIQHLSWLQDAEKSSGHDLKCELHHIRKHQSLIHNRKISSMHLVVDKHNLLPILFNNLVISPIFLICRIKKAPPRFDNAIDS